MAKAIINRIAETFHDSNGYHMTLDVAYAGVEVNSGLENSSVDVVFTGAQTVAQIHSAVGTAIRNQATANGYTVGANGIYSPFTFQLL